MTTVAEIHLLLNSRGSMGEICTTVDNTCYGSSVTYRR